MAGSNRYFNGRSWQLFMLAGVIYTLTPPVELIDRQNDTQIFGIVTDGLTGEPLESVNVYLTYTTFGDATDSNGLYSFTTNLSGQFELVYSPVGYDAKRYVVLLGGSENEIRMDVEMVKHSLTLDEIEVEADNSEWLQNYELFEQEFLGQTPNSAAAEIKNRWVLNFERTDTNELIAFAEDPIQISNRALGYELTADLNEFTWDLRNRSGFYRVKVWFEEKEPSGEEEYQMWQRNRAQVYRGSFRHFLKSLYDDQLFRNRFEIVWQDTDQRARIQQLSEEEMRDALELRNLDLDLISQGVKGFILRESVDVLIGGRSIRSDTRNRARLIPMKDDHIFFVTPDGNLADLMSLATAGHWSVMRMADMVPIDYRP
ncbi:carboxypeptidase-like regulatory domain-containing protein [Rhodohalobacter halophilus]|uniref:carboxypeptidase-like regulatory domain-containing protein n=1 Tax=Rhodohalobacter halophilus TaxID=1812810 RepID=UPI00083F55B9|nr:carboxypeptidase-like regulatory domain-containing protein [Rhodohalobacter halophilus]